MMDNTIFLTHVQERDIDLLLIEELWSNTDFQIWFLSKSIIFSQLESKGAILKNVSHSVSGLGKCKGETDILIDFQLYDGIRLRIMIENKINADFMPQQLERYKERGLLYK